VLAIGTKSVALFNLGRHRQAAMLAKGGLTLAEEFGSHQARADALIYVGVQVSQDDPKEGLQAFLDSADAARRAGIRGVEVIALADAVEAAIDIGRWAEADAVLAELDGKEITGFLAAGVTFSEAMLARLAGGPRGRGRASGRGGLQDGGDGDAPGANVGPQGTLRREPDERGSRRRVRRRHGRGGGRSRVALRGDRSSDTTGLPPGYDLLHREV